MDCTETSQAPTLPQKDSGAPQLSVARPFHINWSALFWIGSLHLGVLLAPFTFSWSGLLVCVVLYLLTGLGVTMG